MKSLLEEVYDLLFDGKIHRIETYPLSMDTPIKFLMIYNNDYSKTQEFLIDREFFSSHRKRSLEMLLDAFYKYQDSNI